MDGHSIKFRPQLAHKSRATSDMDIIFTIQLYSAMMVKSALTYNHGHFRTYHKTISSKYVLCRNACLTYNMVMFFCFEHSVVSALVSLSMKRIFLWIIVCYNSKFIVGVCVNCLYGWTKGIRAPNVCLHVGK